MSINPIIHRSPTYCSHCCKESIDIYNIYNKPIGYPSILRNFNINEVLNIIKDQKYPLAYMRCTSCNRTYIIDWSNGLPKPLRDASIIRSKFGGKRPK